MDLIDIVDDKGNKRQMKVVSIFDINGYDYHYIVYKELDDSRIYLAKFKDNKEDLNTNITEDELKLCEAIMEGVLQ